MEFYDFPYIWNNTPNWLSYFSEGLKPPTSFFWLVRQQHLLLQPHFFCWFVPSGFIWSIPILVGYCISSISYVIYIYMYRHIHIQIQMHIFTYVYIYIIHIVWLVASNVFYFSIYWEFHHPKWTPSFFQRGRFQPPTRWSSHY